MSTASVMSTMSAVLPAFSTTLPLFSEMCRVHVASSVCGQPVVFMPKLSETYCYEGHEGAEGDVSGDYACIRPRIHPAEDVGGEIVLMYLDESGETYVDVLFVGGVVVDEGGDKEDVNDVNNLTSLTSLARPGYCLGGMLPRDSLVYGFGYFEGERVVVSLFDCRRIAGRDVERLNACERFEALHGSFVERGEEERQIRRHWVGERGVVERHFGEAKQGINPPPFAVHSVFGCR